MSEQVKKTPSKQDEVEYEAVETTEVDTSEVDDLLADIDDVLEENAQAFVEAFVQKGGQ